MRQFASGAAVVLIGLVLSSSVRSQTAIRWTMISPGLEVTAADYPHRPPAISSVNVTVLRADPKLYRLRVTDMSSLPHKDVAGSAKSSNVQPYGIPSLRTLILVRRDVAVAINGGFITSYAFPRPQGLVISDTKTISAASSARLLSGVLCIRNTGAVEITS